MSYFDISGATFDENLRKLETSDPAHADVFNALLGQLINNDVALKEAVTKFAASKNEQALFLLNLHKDGKKYGVHFDNYDVTPSSNGTRLFDAVGMTAAPSTNAVRAVNDFDGKGCFAYLEVNGLVDENGDFQVQYIKDIDNEFSRTKYDTWCLYLTQYVYRKFDSNGEDTVISDTRHSAEWLPEGGAIRPDGTIRPFVAIAKYMSGDNADGVASSISGVSPKNYSFQSSLTKFRAKGTQYCAETSQDSERMTRLMEIAFATRHSQSVMAGCNWWWTQATATVQENNAERIIISKSAAKEFVVGGTVSIGNANSLTSEGKANNDRGLSGLHAKANKVKITKIEDYDSNKRKKYQYNWIKIIVILFVIVFLISTLCQEIDIIAQALKFNLPETLIIGFVIISLFIYIPLTECVIDEVKFYRVKSIASIVQFLILLVIYITSMMDMSSDDVGNIYDIMIFAIGQIAFAESAISNYKSMYKKLKEEKKDEVEKYLEGVDKQYEKNEEMIRSDIKEAKNFVGEIVDLWSKMNWKQRIKVVGVLLAFIGFYVLLIWISTLLSNI